MKRLTTEEFIDKCKKIHTLYDYNLVNYINSSTRVKIVCRIHGEFNQLPLNHLKGSGCPICSGNKKLTIEDFISRSNLLHNNKFNYSLVKFNNNDSIIEIICPNHGVFKQIVNKHLKGYGCNSCNHDNRRTNVDDFINRSNIIHNNKYDYSLVEYRTTNTKIKIICRKHGIFEKTPKNHLNKQGCQKCFYITTNKFIEMCEVIHNNRYDYSLVKYEHSLKNIEIICKEHGKFQQLPTSHIKGNGCQECGKMGYNIEEFIKKSNLIHNNKYNYEESIYTGTINKITILCPIHGEFKQRAADHLRGSGCQKCGERFGVKENKWLDSLNIEKRQIRIGKYVVDGYDEDTNTIYEFNGDFWHGNPNIYDYNDINIVNNKTFGELYENTINREKYLKDKGYKVVSVWESDVQ